MKQKIQYTSIETIFSKFQRDLRETDISEADLVEWTAEALGFMKVVELQEEALAFIEVENYQAEIPCGFQGVIQIARNNDWTPYDKENTGTCPCDILEETPQEEQVTPPVFVDCQGNIIGDAEIAYYRPYFDLRYEYAMWAGSGYYKEKFTPVRLANHTFLGTLVAELNEDKSRSGLYSGSQDEYTIAGGYPNMNFRFSFKEGEIALSYLRTIIEPETGYPVIPDDIRFITAITYYIKWKMAERFRWNGREGFSLEAKDAEKKWNKYVRQAINSVKMPQGIDEYQNIMENSLYLIPRSRMYYGYFGKLGREENRLFNNPDMRRKYSFNRYGIYEPVFTKNTAFNKNFGTIAGTVTEGNDPRLPNTRTLNKKTGVINAALSTSVVHGLGSDDVIAQVITLSGEVVECDITTVSGVTTFNFNVAPEENMYRYIIIG